VVTLEILVLTCLLNPPTLALTSGLAETLTSVSPKRAYTPMKRLKFELSM
jgi:hypothetical protein